MIYEFTPTQDLHGYDAPWPAGGGKNLLNVPQSVSLSNVGYLANKVAINLPAGAYTLSFNCSSVGSDKRFQLILMAGETQIFSQTGDIASTVTLSFTTTQAADHVVIFCNNSNAATYTNAMIESGSTATAYAPYSNVCPISGYNIWDPVEDKMVPVYSGYVDANARELYLRPVYKEYAGEELVGPWMSSLDPYAEDTTPTEGAFVIDFGGELTSLEITPFMLQTLLDSLGIRQHFTDGAGLLNSLMDQAQGRVRSEEELLNRSLPLHVIAIGEDLPTNLVIKKPVSDVLPGLPGKFIR